MQRFYQHRVVVVIVEYSKLVCVVHSTNVWVRQTNGNFLEDGADV